MKTRTILISILAIVAFMNSLSAQTIVYDAITVNGLKVGERYTPAQFVKALGTPTKVIPPSKTDEYDDAYTYYYGKDRFYLISGEFYGFKLNTPIFKLNNLLCVGDPISKINQLGGIRGYGQNSQVKVIHWQPSKEGIYEWTYVAIYCNENDFITSMSAFIHDL